jgi:hypothetical protein
MLQLAVRSSVQRQRNRVILSPQAKNLGAPQPPDFTAEMLRSSAWHDWLDTVLRAGVDD